MSPALLGAIVILLPVAIAALLVVVAPLRRSGRPAAYVSVLGALASFAAAVGLLFTVHDPVVHTYTWLPAAGQPIATIGMQLDGISIPMLCVVGLVALCVQVFSLEYLADEPPADFGRYFTWQSLFLFSMQSLVVAPNMLQLFMSWELVGVCSYLLIGYWWTKPSAARAAVKAFWVTKFADMGLLIGLIVQYAGVSSFGWDQTTVDALVAGGLAPLVAGLFFIAVMGKSAQFPLHIWLPDAMEGPTPVSALLHAATMVAAGVYLIVRAWPIFEVSGPVLLFMSVIGGITALMAACIAVVQTDIKRVLAYSTCSQLGYMIAALGAGSLMGGYFHLTTHAFFKALLFLAAGSVIHAVHSNELSAMGGLRKKMPLTTVVFIIGALALAGAPGLSGYFSKDIVLEGLLHGAQHGSPILWLPLAACMITVGLTAYYMTRVVALAFFGEASEPASHAHESGWLVRIPLLLLAGGAIIVGPFVEPFAHSIGVHDAHLAIVPTPVGAMAIALAFGGAGLAWFVEVDGRGKGLATALKPVGDFIRSAPIDTFWQVAYQRGLLAFSAVLGWFDRFVIDGVMNASGAGTLLAGDRIRAVQTGRVNDYVAVVVIGLLALAALSQLLPMLGAAT